MIGDAIPGGNSDLLYTGDAGATPFSMQYYRNKAVEFQSVLNSLDLGQSVARDLVASDIDPDLSADLSAMLDEFDARRTALRITAEAINAGAAVINSMGGRFPQLSVPSGLGLLPAVPIAAVAALATAATLIAWGVTWLQGLNARLQQAQQLAAVTDPGARAELARAMATSDAALAQATGNPLSNLAGIVKWGALAFGAFLIYRAWNTSRSAD